jgi:integrase
MVNLILHTGLRRGEVFSLCWEDIDLDSPILHVRAANAKSSKDRYIPLNKDVVTLLKGWRLRSGNREGLVFRNPAGYQLRDIKRQWIKLMKAAEISDFRFHDLRHDFASRLVQASVDLYRVKDLLGHSTITLTERYSHLQPRHLRDAVQKLETS